MAMRGRDPASDATAASPIRHHLKPSRGHRGNQIITNLVGHRLIEDAFIAKGLAVQLEALELDTDFIGLESNRHCAEIRVPCHWAHRRKLLIDVLNKKWGLDWRGKDFEK